MIDDPGCSCSCWIGDMHHKDHLAFGYNLLYVDLPSWMMVMVVDVVVEIHILQIWIVIHHDRVKVNVIEDDDEMVVVTWIVTWTWIVIVMNKMDFLNMT